MSGPPSVLVLGGGPDAERAVSLASAAAVAEALRAGGFGVEPRTIDRLDGAELASLPGEVIFPVLHGPWGEGGPLQDLLEADGRAYVGCGPAAARAAMDKVRSKELAVRAGGETPDWSLLRVGDPTCPLPVPVPVVVKPVHDGSSVGLFVCRTETTWSAAYERIASGEFGHRVFMVERMVSGREVSVGLLNGPEPGRLDTIGVVEIVPASGVYDHEAKYERDDTRYVVDPDLPSGVADRLGAVSTALAAGMGLRHLARVDFIVDVHGGVWFLEVNTMPGFTPSSLLPKMAAAGGVDMRALVAGLVRRANDEARRDRSRAV